MIHEQWEIQDSKPGLCDSKACAHLEKCQKPYFPPSPALSAGTCLISLPSRWSWRAKGIIPISQLRTLRLGEARWLSGFTQLPSMFDARTKLSSLPRSSHPCSSDCPVASVSAPRAATVTTIGSITTVTTTERRPSTAKTVRWWQTLNKVFAYEKHWHFCKGFFFALVSEIFTARLRPPSQAVTRCAGAGRGFMAILSSQRRF